MAGVESQKDQFRRYLESSGSIDALVRVLVSLYEEPEKPKAALDFIKSSLGGPTPAEYDSVVAERNGLREMVAALQADLEAAKTKISELEGSSS